MTASNRTPIAVPGAARSLSRAQREFNRLTQRIARERARLAAWEACREQCRTRVLAELEPLDQALRAVHRRFLLRADALLAQSGPFPKRKQRARLRALVVEDALGFLARGRDAEIEALHDRHAGSSYAEHRRVEIERASGRIADAFGVRVSTAGVESVHELMARVHEQADARETKRREKREARRRGKEAGTAGAGVAQDAPRAVRDIYRKLASALHPDREADPVARARKTALMQRANQAYARGDLVELLGLQLEIEQVDPRHLGGAPDALLERYNHVLAEQSRTLERATRELREGIAAALGQPDLLRDPDEAERIVRARIEAARTALASGENDLARLESPVELDALLADFMQDDDPYEALGLDFFVLSEEPEPPRGSRRGKKRR